MLPTLTRARKAHFLIGLLLEGFLNPEMAYWLCGRQLDPPHTPARFEENALHLLHSFANGQGIHRIHKWRTRGKKLVPSHESEALEDKQKLQMKTFSELAEC